MCADVDADAEITIVKLVKIIKYGLEGIKMDVKEKKRGTRGEAGVDFCTSVVTSAIRVLELPLYFGGGVETEGAEFWVRTSPQVLWINFRV